METRNRRRAIVDSGSTDRDLTLDQWDPPDPTVKRERRVGKRRTKAVGKKVIDRKREEG